MLHPLYHTCILYVHSLHIEKYEAWMKQRGRFISADLSGYAIAGVFLNVKISWKIRGKRHFSAGTFFVVLMSDIAHCLKYTLINVNFLIRRKIYKRHELKLWKFHSIVERVKFCRKNLYSTKSTSSAGSSNHEPANALSQRFSYFYHFLLSHFR